MRWSTGTASRRLCSLSGLLVASTGSRLRFDETIAACGLRTPSASAHAEASVTASSSEMVPPEESRCLAGEGAQVECGGDVRSWRWRE